MYLATDKASEEMGKVILKLFRYKNQPHHIKSYIDQETHIANKFKKNIPGIAKYNEVNWFENKRGVFVIQEYIQSSSLHDRIINSLFTEKEAVRMAIELCKTLSHVHNHKVVHCDIKPKNILLPVNNSFTPIIIDFGTSRMFGESTPSSESLITIPYSAPELVKGHPVDGRTDIYSLAVTILHMISGLSDWESRSIDHFDYATMATNNYKKNETSKSESHLERILNQVSNEELKYLLNKCKVSLDYKAPPFQKSYALSQARTLLNDLYDLRDLTE